MFLDDADDMATDGGMAPDPSPSTDADDEDGKDGEGANPAM